MTDKKENGEEGMEKYGVDENEELQKKGSTVYGTCPRCGARVNQHGTVHICPRHGSEPFEKEDEQRK